MRIDNWPRILGDAIKEIGAEPFQWGKTDCIQFAGRCAARILDYDLLTLANADGRYSSEDAAMHVINDEYGGDIESIMDDVFHRRENERFAQAGDIVSLVINDNIVFGIVEPSGRYVAVKTKDGVTMAPHKLIKTAWEVV